MLRKFPKQSKGFHPFGDLIGLNFTDIGKGSARCVLDVDKQLYNPHRVLHGAVIYAMADTGMGGALFSYLEDDESCATIEVKINYFKPVKSEMLTCDTRVIHKGKKVAVLESEVMNGEDLVTIAIGTYSIFKMSKNEK